MFAVKKFTVPEWEHAVVNILKPCVGQTVPMVAVRWTNYRSCYWWSWSWWGTQVWPGIDRTTIHCLYSIERSLFLNSDADAGQGWSKKFQIGSWNWRHNAYLNMQQQYNDSCTTSSDFYIGGSARCQLGDRGMHLAEKSDQDTLAIPYCHFQPEIRFRYQVTRKPPQNARSESGYGRVGLLLFQPGHKMA